MDGVLYKYDEKKPNYHVFILIFFFMSSAKLFFSLIQSILLFGSFRLFVFFRNFYLLKNIYIYMERASEREKEKQCTHAGLLVGYRLHAWASTKINKYRYVESYKAQIVREREK